MKEKMLEWLFQVIIRNEYLRTRVVDYISEYCDIQNVTIKDAKDFHISDSYIGRIKLVDCQNVNVTNNIIKTFEPIDQLK